MRVTIEPTQGPVRLHSTGEVIHHRKVIIEVPSDEIGADEAIAMCNEALVAYGYHPDNIYEKE